MRHKIAGRKFNRTSSHRQALFMNLVNALITSEQIKTTLPKAKDLRPIIERLITMARNNTLHTRRVLLSRLRSQETVSKLLTVLADRYRDRPGGYTRIVKAGFRFGDAAPMAIIEFVDRSVETVMSTNEPKKTVIEGEAVEAPAKKAASSKKPAAKKSKKEA